MKTHILGIKLKIQWIPSHKDIQGNETSDLIAKQRHFKNETTLSKISREEIVRNISLNIQKQWESEWRTNCHILNKGKFILNISEEMRWLPWLCHQNRHTESTLARLRVGHAGTRAHLYRFNMHLDCKCECGMQETIEHYLLICGQHSSKRRYLALTLQQLKVPLILKNILECGDFVGSKQESIIDALMRYIEETGRLQDL